MQDDRLFGRVHFSVSTGLVPWDDPGEYVQRLTGSAYALDAGDAEEPIGEITARFINLTEVINRGEVLWEVCDADSALLEGMYCALFDEDGEVRDELDIEPTCKSIILIEEVTIEPAYRDTRLAVQPIETTAAVFCPDGLVVAVENALNLTIAEWRSLGFRRVPDSGFVCRDQAQKNPYGESEW